MQHIKRFILIFSLLFFGLGLKPNSKRQATSDKRQATSDKARQGKARQGKAP
jgi:hypothetical protein